MTNGNTNTYQSSNTQREGRAADRTLSSRVWAAVVSLIVLAIVLLTFILQNQQNATISLLVWDFNIPLGVSLLLSAVLGGLIVAIAGAFRIIQLRRIAGRRTANRPSGE